MEILFLSSLSSERVINDIHSRTGRNPGYAVQKFNRLLVSGLIDSGAKVTALSNPPLVNTTTHKKFVALGEEVENRITYRYVPFINFPFLKHLCIATYTFFYVLLWGLSNRKQKAIVCDVLSVSLCAAALIASKLNRLKTIGVVTDIYGLMVGNGGTGIKRLLSSLATKLNASYVSRFSGYVLLTEAMNKEVNPKQRPYLVMEALCDNTITDEQIAAAKKSIPPTMLYAGGLFEKYGLKMLVEGFIRSTVEGKLVIYGAGPYEHELRTVCKSHPCVEYRGVAPNSEVVVEELKATLLVNPRFTTETFTKFSFPSKNMEYMVSGTPLLTTKLPGMPKDYFSHVYLFDEETTEGYAKTIRNIFQKTSEELRQKGDGARKFVLEQKNKQVQTARIVKLIQDIHR